ncbi:MAG: hypothetical protein COW70_11810 [Hydrogenophilales bacterium CG18_big_fil_WC_8_21_14_2_50_58_12]|nr:MAG: hypothetical protein COW70_11810 [Hydrogenophilales bacterium CG18_big_fil_WC_8_21_14_2_50_58_12]
MLVIALMIGSASAKDTAFRRVQLPYGISLEIPSHWEIFSQDEKQNFAAAAESMGRNAGGAEDSGKKERLLAVSARPFPSGAKIRVSVTTPPEYTQADLAATTAAELSQLRSEYIAMFNKMLASGGARVLEMQTPQIERINNKLALAMAYTRTDPDGPSPWQVTQYGVPVPKRLIQITLSYRQSDAIIWKPILENVKRSIRF